MSRKIKTSRQAESSASSAVARPRFTSARAASSSGPGMAEGKARLSWSRDVSSAGPNLLRRRFLMQKLRAIV
jgi:hypothetical protein